MSKERNIEIKIKTLHYGQTRPYGWSIYEYEVTTNMTEHETKMFCLKVLKPASEKCNHPLSMHMLSFKKIEGKENVYIYKCGHDYLD